VLGMPLAPSMQSSASTTCSAARCWPASKVRGGRSTSSRRSAKPTSISQAYRLVLRPVDIAETAAMLLSVSGQDAPASAVVLIHGVGNGNPFFTQPPRPPLLSAWSYRCPARQRSQPAHRGRQRRRRQADAEGPVPALCLQRRRALMPGSSRSDNHPSRRDRSRSGPRGNDRHDRAGTISRCSARRQESRTPRVRLRRTPRSARHRPTDKPPSHPRRSAATRATQVRYLVTLRGSGCLALQVVMAGRQKGQMTADGTGFALIGRGLTDAPAWRLNGAARGRSSALSGSWLRPGS